MTVRTRFAPSPTGYLHIGSARSCLFNALFSARHQGVFILRIEDTDVTRSQVAYALSQQNDLHWLGIHWQEGPGVEGPYAPYWQSQRQPIYNQFYAKLEADNEIYPCFCTDQELMLARKLQMSRGQPPRYSGVCKKLSANQIADKIAAGESPAWRFAVKPNVTIEFSDLIKGPQSYSSNDIGDFIVRRKDGTSPFLFGNAIDDAKMKITHVVRGEDHLSNTIRQVLILQTLDLPIPQYAHLSLIVGNDGAPLSKRHGSYSLEEMRNEGYLAPAILNYLSRLGHSYESSDLLSFKELAENFNLEKVSRSPARFDDHQLMYWQKVAIQKMDNAALRAWLGEAVLQYVPVDAQALFIEAIKANIAFPKDALVWAKIFFAETTCLDASTLPVIQEAGEAFFREAGIALETHGTDLPAVLNQLKQNLNVSGKALFMPLRIALTGKTHGPELAHIAGLLGIVKMKQRLDHALAYANEDKRKQAQ